MPSKVLFATCSMAEKWLSTGDADDGHYPLGIAYLQSVLEKAGHTVQMLFLNHVPYEDCLRRIIATIDRFKPQFLCLSMITDSRVSSFRVIAYVHAHYPDIKIVLGGVHVTTMHEQIARRFPYCILALGEAENTLVELIQAWETQADLSEIAGLAFCENGQVIRTPERALIEDLDSLPFPKHAAFFHEERRSAQLLTSRGCPFNCTFCVMDSFSKRKVRYRSPQNVVDEIEFVLGEFPQVQRIQILDDQFFCDNKRVIEICDEIVRRKIKCSFECCGRMKPLSREMILALERAGFNRVYIGLESGARDILKRCKKGITPDDALHAFDLFAHSKLEIYVLLIVGLPGESLVTILESAKLIQQLQMKRYHTYSRRIQTIFVYPGSALYEMCKQAGALDDSCWLTEQDVPNYTLEHSHQELGIFLEALLTYISPVRLMTPGGLAAQRQLLPQIVRHAFLSPELRPLANLALHAADQLLAEGAITFTVAENLVAQMQAQGRAQLTTIVREVGTDGCFQINCSEQALKDAAKHIVSFAYIHGFRELTDKIDARIAEILEQNMKQQLSEENILRQLGLTPKWVKATHNEILARL